MSTEEKESQDKGMETTDGSPPASPKTYADSEVTLLDGLLIVARKKKVIVYAVAVFTLLGFLYAVLAPTEYTSTAQVVREAPIDATNLPGGLAAISSGLGLSLGARSSGLTPDAYPLILKSREVRLAVARETYYFPDVERRMSYVDYYNREPGVGYLIWKYTVRLPWTLKKELFPAPPRSAGTDSSGAIVYPTEEEEEAIEDLLARVSSSVDIESGIMSIRFTAGDPGPAASITHRFLSHLTERVRSIRTSKTRQTLDFVSQRFENAKQELRQAEEELARFTDRNQSINSARLQTERDRLQRQVRFASDLYSDLQKQVTQSRIEVQRSEPVITIVEEPVPPLERSSPKRTILLVMSVILGFLAGVVLAFVSYYVDAEAGTDKHRKINMIKNKLVPSVGKYINERS